MKIKKLIGWLLIVATAAAYIKYILFTLPWYVLPIGLVVASVIVGFIVLVCWLLGDDEEDEA